MMDRKPYKPLIIFGKLYNAPYWHSTCTLRVSKIEGYTQSRKHILQNTYYLTLPSRRNKGLKAGNQLHFSVLPASLFCPFLKNHLHFAPFSLSSCPPTRNFFAPNYTLLAPKTILFNGYFAPFGHIFNGSKRFYLYHFRGYLCASTHIQHHFALHLAPFCLAFCTKTHCILHQNTLRLAPKCTAFSSKMQCILLQIGSKLVRTTAFLNKNSFYRIHMLTPFYIENNSRENRFFAAGSTIG